MNQTANHPDEATLAAFLAGRLQGASQRAVESHVEGCHKCCDRLSHIDRSPTDTLSGQLRSVDTSPSADFQLNDASGAHASPAAPLRDGPPSELTDHPRYRILEPLGRGGMGVVYKAEHRMMGRVVALKVIDERFISNRQAIERFRNEVKAAGRLNHPNIVRAYDAEQAGRTHFLVMEFVDGISLAELVERKGPLPVDQANGIIRKVCHGLHHAFRHEMVHRDIKPQNIMVTQDGKVRILDFGLARLARSEPPTAHAAEPQMHRTADALTHVGLVLGTPDYIAPEQARDAHQIDIRADIYSLGCTWYFLLTGRPPFPEGTAMQKLVAHMEESPPAVHELRPDVPGGVAQVLRHAMQRLPQDRLQTPAEMAAAIEAAMDADNNPFSLLESAATSVRPRTDRSEPSERNPLPETSTDHALDALAAAAGQDASGSSNKTDLSAQRRRGPSMQSQRRSEAGIPIRALAIGCMVLFGTVIAIRGLPSNHKAQEPSEERVTSVPTSDAESDSETNGGSRQSAAPSEPTPRPTEAPAFGSSATTDGRGRTPEPAVNLIDLFDPHEAVSGSWQFRNEELHVNATAWARLPLAVDLPEEYDLTVEFTRQTGQHSVGVVFSHGGQQASFEVDAWSSYLAGVQNIDGQTLESPSNPTSVGGIRLQNGERCRLLLQVRRDSLTGRLNGQPLFRHASDGSDLSLLEEWRLPATATLGLIAYESATVFHSIQLRSAVATR